jgi:hypothetical protein
MRIAYVQMPCAEGLAIDLASSGLKEAEVLGKNPTLARFLIYWQRFTRYYLCPCCGTCCGMSK